MLIETPSIDIDAYLARIGFSGSRDACLEVLEGLHECHAGTVPFENLDVRLGRPILLDLASLESKLVGARRGGYCFEQNTLFAAVLSALGFEVATLEARVRPPGAASVLPRTHMVLGVRVGEKAFLADVGFGGDGPLWPVPMDGTVSSQPGADLRVVEEGTWRVLQSGKGGTWTDLYAFSGEPVFPVDYEVANHFTSTHPRSKFVRSLTVQLSTREARYILRGRSYTVKREGAGECRELSMEEIPNLLRERFGLDLPDADLLRAAGEAPS
ncbi:MAG: arylamine N-acetyltransferase [Acidobacteria bacterium]|nr:arylamine N-acetyltransferase [Acidobacteriota bacterium]